MKNLNSIYADAGCTDRNHYLSCLAEEYGVDEGVVYSVAVMLGPSEDFDGLVVALEDYVEGLWDY